jgi:DNA-binding NarL/FixJ family response regulator
MNKPNIQIGDIIREMTDEEYANLLVVREENATAEAQEEAKIANRESALAKLAKLGLTQDEIASL